MRKSTWDGLFIARQAKKRMPNRTKSPTPAETCLGM